MRNCGLDLVRVGVGFLVVVYCDEIIMVLYGGWVVIVVLLGIGKIIFVLFLVVLRCFGWVIVI